MSDRGLSKLIAAKEMITPLVSPVPIDSLRLINYIAYGRRVVTEVFPPQKCDGLAFMSTFYRLRTVPAPWTMDERWKEPSPIRRSEMEGNADADSPEEDDTEDLALELEQDTIPEPAEVDIWVDGKALGLEGNASWLVGIGLRARWVEVGVDKQQSWWIARLKDCEFTEPKELTEVVFPSIWRMSDADRAAAEADPPAPYNQPQYTARQGNEDGRADEGEDAGEDAGAGTDAGVAKAAEAARPTEAPIELVKEDGDDLPGVEGVVDAVIEGADDFDDILDDDDEEGVVTVVMTPHEAPASDDEGDFDSAATRVEPAIATPAKVTGTTETTAAVPPKATA